MGHQIPKSMLVNMTGVTWPADFPTDCPPEQAFDADGIYYRVAKNNPPETGDFESTFHRDYDRAIDAMRKGRTKCETMGLSVYTDMNDAIKCAGIFRKMGREIVQLTLTRSPVKAALTEGLFESHHTLWVPEEFDLTQHSHVVRSL